MHRVRDLVRGCGTALPLQRHEHGVFVVELRRQHWDAARFVQDQERAIVMQHLEAGDIARRLHPRRPCVHYAHSRAHRCCRISSDSVHGDTAMGDVVEPRLAARVRVLAGEELEHARVRRRLLSPHRVRVRPARVHNMDAKCDASRRTTVVPPRRALDLD